jgi:hypothetical protein
MTERVAGASLSGGVKHLCGTKSAISANDGIGILVVQWNPLAVSSSLAHTHTHQRLVIKLYDRRHSRKVLFIKDRFALIRAATLRIAAVWSL